MEVPIATIVLHIGAFKTGTSFLQHTLGVNADRLAQDGVLVPADEQGSRLRIFRDFWQGREGPDDPSTTHLVSQCRAWTGTHVVLSAERLSLLRPNAAGRLIEALSPNPVRVVLGARDIERTVPSQWQSFIRGFDGAAWTYRDYVEGVRRGRGSGLAGLTYWDRHDIPKLLRRWDVGQAETVLLTVPHSGPADVLWHRFGSAAGFDTTGYAVARMKNASMGAQSAELVRRLNLRMLEQAGGSSASLRGEEQVLRVMVRRVFSRRRGQELRVAFPAEYSAWASQRSAELLAELGDLRPQLVGNLQELTPRAMPAGPGTTTRPEELPLAELLEAAESALDRLTRGGAQTLMGSGNEQARLDRAVDALIEIIRARTERARARTGSSSEGLLTTAQTPNNLPTSAAEDSAGGEDD